MRVNVRGGFWGRVAVVFLLLGAIVFLCLSFTQNVETDLDKQVLFSSHYLCGWTD